MSAPAHFQPGSFRGASFRTEFHERTGGRRVAVHEFPARDEPVVEDLGRRARQFSIDCHVMGDSYGAERDALIEALEGAGPGLLVHPWFGSMMVSVLDYSASETTEEGRIGRFRIMFIEAGLPAPAPGALGNGQASASTADSVIADAGGIFAGQFSIEGAAAFVEDGATDTIKGIATVTEIAAGLRGGIGPTLRAFASGLRFLPDNIGGLLRAPAQLGISLTGLVQAVSALDGSGGRRTRLQPFEIMLDWVPDQPVFPERTPQRIMEADNRRALLQLFRTASAAELVRSAATLSYPSYDAAVATRDGIADRLDILAVQAADRGDDASAALLDRLRLALARDIARIAPTLERTYRLRLPATIPALVLSHRLYADRRDAGVSPEARAQGIVERNNVRHPGFLPAATELELLTVSGGRRAL